MRYSPPFVLALSLALLALPFARTNPVQAATLTFTVNSTVDAPDAHPGDGVCATSGGKCTLRAATQEADAQPAGSSIDIIVPSGTYTLTLGTLQLTANRITLSGAMSSTTTINGNNNSTVLAVSPPAQASISGVTITGGSTSANGGGIANSGTLTLSNSTLSRNSALAGGGIAINSGSVTLSNSTIISNTSTDFGGGGIAINSGSVTLSNSTISGNTASADFGGGGIAINSGSATLTNSTISGNTAGAGGGIYNQNGTLTLTNSTVSGNTALYSGGEGGGGIANDSGSATLTNSTVSGNTSLAHFGAGGGGILNKDTLTLSDSIVSGNTAEYGGGIQNFASMTLTNSTIISNTVPVGSGGGIDNENGSVTLTDSTVSVNRASDRGAGIDNENGSVTLTDSTVSVNLGFGITNIGTLTLTNSTISGNTAPNEFYGAGITNFGTVALTGTILSTNVPGPNCKGPIGEGQGYNLDSGTSCGFSRTTDLTNTDPLLGPLADNGGPTPTMALLPGSPAIDHGDTHATGCPATDQRGRPRPDEASDIGACDIGAYEAQAPASKHRLTVQTSGLGATSTHISNGGTLLGTASDASPLSVSLPAGTPLTLTADALVSAADGTQYFFQGFTPSPPTTLTTDVTTTARYETMAQVISAALATGGIYGPGAQGQAQALTQQFAAVQADLAAHNAAQALLDTQSFIGHVQAQTGKKITPATATTLVLDALLVYHAALCQAKSAGQISAAQANADYSYYSGLVTQLGAIPLGPC
jgi:CSLREA domain-containing protein